MNELAKALAREQITGIPIEIERGLFEYVVGPTVKPPAAELSQREKKAA